LVILVEATEKDCIEIHKMQTAAYKSLLDKYNDFATNPGAETIERIRQRFGHPTVKHYFVVKGAEKIGYIRVSQLGEYKFRLSQMFILPDFRGKGYAQSAILEAERLYPSAQKWELDTIKQEPQLLHLYQKMGYSATGEENILKKAWI
jgi:hypothetical protein